MILNLKKRLGMGISMPLAIGPDSLSAGGRYTITDADAAAYVARMPAQPSASRKRAIDEFFIELKGAGVYTKIDAMWDLEAPTEGAALLNVKGASYTLTKSGNGPIRAGFGWTGDRASSSFLNTNFTPSTAGGQYALNSAELGVFVLDPQNPNDGTRNFAFGVNASPGSRLEAQNLPNYKPVGYVNVSSGTAAGSDGLGRLGGLFAVSTEDGANQKIRKNGLTLTTTALATTGLPTTPIWIGRSGSLYSIETHSFAYIAKGLTNAETLALFNAVRTYLQAVMRPIVCFGDSLTQGIRNMGSSPTATTTSYPSRLSARLGRAVANGGISGETSGQIRLRQVEDTFFNYGLSVIRAGRNNYSSQATVLSDIALMVAHIPHNRFVIMSVQNGEYATEYAGQTGYNQIVALNAALQAAYPDNYLDIRSALIADGLAFSGITPTAQDTLDISRDVVPLSLRSDNIHMNDAGDDFTAYKVAQFISAKGW